MNSKYNPTRFFESIITNINDIEKVNNFMKNLPTEKNNLSKNMIDHLFGLAVEVNNIDMVKSFVKEGVIGQEKTSYLSWSIMNKNINMLNLLISTYKLDETIDESTIPDKYDPSYGYSEDERVRIFPLLTAVQDEGKTSADILNTLLSVTLPRKMDSIALYEAVRNTNKTAIDILIDVSDVEKVNQKIDDVLDGNERDILLSYEGVKYFKEKMNIWKIKKDKEEIKGYLNKTVTIKPIVKTKKF